LRKNDVECRVLTAITMNKIAEPYVRFRAMRHLQKGRVVIFAAGTGNPFFTTDTAAALRAAEIDAELMLMAKNKVDGIYDKDPRKFADAKKYDSITYDEVIHENLKIMDTAATSLCKNSEIPIIVFDFEAKGAIEKILKGEKIGTIVGGNHYEYIRTDEKRRRKNAKGNSHLQKRICKYQNRPCKPAYS
jgi:uridylate kinase